jgi:hypothetical protein
MTDPRRDWLEKLAWETPGCHTSRSRLPFEIESFISALLAAAQDVPQTRSWPKRGGI